MAKLRAVDDIKGELEQLNDEILGATDEVSAALESGEDQRQLAAGRLVEELSRRYSAFVDKLPAGERDRVERSHGRRITDLRRSAAQLTRRASGQAVARAVDAGSVPFLLTRSPPKQTHSQPLSVPRERPRYSVGGEVEAWCGKCAGLRDHHIVAMVGDEPKQVICQSCKSRHGFRTEPARKAAPAPATLVEKRAVVAADREQVKKQDARRALQKELADTVEPRPFDPKGATRRARSSFTPSTGAARSRTCSSRACWCASSRGCGRSI